MLSWQRMGVSSLVRVGAAALLAGTIVVGIVGCSDPARGKPSVAGVGVPLVVGDEPVVVDSVVSSWFETQSGGQPGDLNFGVNAYEITYTVSNAGVGRSLCGLAYLLVNEEGLKAPYATAAIGGVDLTPKHCKSPSAVSTLTLHTGSDPTVDLSKSEHTFFYARWNSDKQRWDVLGTVVLGPKDVQK